jgi:tetratricopeptide (TPR) repeat protein
LYLTNAYVLAYGLSQLNQAKKLLQNIESIFEKNNYLIKNHLIQGLYFWIKGIIDQIQGNYDQSRDHFSTSLQYYVESNNKEGIANIYLNLGNIDYYKGNLESAVSNYQKSHDLFEQLQNKIRMSTALNNLGSVYLKLGKIDSAFEFHKQNLKLREETGNKAGIASTLINLANIYAEKGDHINELKLYEQSLEIYLKIGNKAQIGLLKNNIGLLFLQKGDFEKALSSFQDSLKIREVIGDKSGIAYSLTHIGNVKKEIDLLDEAMDYHYQSLTLFEEIDDRYGIGLNYFHIGLIQADLTNFKSAEDYLLKAENIMKHLGYKLSTIKVIYSLITNVYNYNHDYDKMEKKFHELKEMINDYKDSRRFKHMISLSQALVYISKRRMNMKAKAIDILWEIINDEVVESGTTLTAMFNLCNLLFLDLKINDDDSDVILMEISELLKKMENKALEQNRVGKIIELLILEAKFALIRGELKEADLYLAQAEVLASDNNLIRFEKLVKTEREIFDSQISQWKQMAESSVTISQRLELAKVEDYLITVKQLKRDFQKV